MKSLASSTTTRAMLGSSVTTTSSSCSRVRARASTSMTMRIGPPKFFNTRSDRAMKKARLLTTIEPLKRGLECDEETSEQVDNLCQALEKVNPTAEPLASDLVNGQWRLVYTTSESILGKKKKKFLQPSGPIYQTIDAESLKARNQETGPLYNRVDAVLIPEENSVSKVKVQFKTFRILGLIPIKAPASARGELDITYLDEDMRICRGDKGNLFVLLMEDPSVRLR